MKEQKNDTIVMGRIALAKAEWLDWIAENGKVVVITAASLLVVLFVTYQLIGKFGGKSRTDFTQGDIAYAAWASKEKFDPELFKQLQKPLSSHPELNQKFGAMIAQRLLSLNEGKRAQSFGLAALKRTQGSPAGYYNQFSKSSLLISDGKLKEALEGAKRLKQAMEEDQGFWEGQQSPMRIGSVLYAFNLLRIAFLEKEAGSPMGELLAWQELIRKAGWNGVPAESITYDPEAYVALLQNFKEQDVTLLDYIHTRLKALSVPSP